jgi:hypothetical protein
MQIHFQSLTHVTFNYLQENLLSSLTSRQKIIITIAAAAFACLAALFAVSRFCLNKKVEIENEQKKQSIENKDEVKNEPQKVEIETAPDSPNKKEEKLSSVENKDEVKDETQEVKKEAVPDADDKKDGSVSESDESEDDDQNLIWDKDLPLVVRKRPDVYDQFIPPSHFTPQETTVARRVIGEWMHKYKSGYAFSCPGMQMMLVELESRKKVMNYLLENGFIEAWTFGYSGIPLVKTFLTDKAPPMQRDNTLDTCNGFQCMPHPSSWRTLNTIKNEQEFIKRNWIDLNQFSEDELKNRFPDEQQRSLFVKVVKDLNTRVNKRPYPINDNGQERPILEYLIEKKLIRKIEEKVYHNSHPPMHQFNIYPLK